MPPRTFGALLLFMSIAAIAVLFSVERPEPTTAAEVHFVTKNIDTNDGVCGADCSLREAIIAANGILGQDTINVPAGNYALSIAGNGEDAAASGDLDITDSVIIQGAGAALTTVDAAGLDRVFDVIGLIEVEIHDLTVTGGLAGPDTSRNGGGIQNSDATLLLEDLVVTGNETGDFNGASGGGIVNVDEGVVTINSSEIVGNMAPNHNNTGAGVANTELGVMTINDSIISGNVALQDGGGVMNANAGLMTINDTIISNNSGRFGGGFSHGNGATAIINDSVISGNEAMSGGGVESDQGTEITINRTRINGNTADDQGGGVYVSQSGVATINDSEISNNDATIGGGIHNQGSETVTVTNSTVSGNSALDDSGGINNSGTGSVQVLSSTVTDNTADGDTNGSGDGGGIGVDSGTVEVENSIVAGNHDPTSDPDCFGTVTSMGYNLIGVVSAGCSIAGDSTGNVTGVDALLGALEDNGGTTQTHALQEGSPAIDAGSPDCPPPLADQRGVSRPRDGDGDLEAICDIGAYEAPGDPPTPTPSPTPAGPTPVARDLVWGDYQCDNDVNPIDGLLTLRHDAGLNVNTGDCPPMGIDIEVLSINVAGLGEGDGDPQVWGNVDCDSQISPIDALKILRHDAGLSVSQEAGCPPVGSDVTVQYAP